QHDVLGMARHGILAISSKMIHPAERNIVSVTTSIRVVVYNRKLFSESDLPAKWEDFLKPEFKGKKFVMDLQPLGLAALVPAWGQEKTLDFARKVSAQQPDWGSGATRINTAVATGEYPIYWGSNFNAVKSAMGKDPTGNLNYKVIEPVPARIVDD